jgi:hypothetical protein
MVGYMKELINRAKGILEKNWVGNHTKPSSLLYPHQWSWDSGFIAIGYSTYDQKKAELELKTLFRGQWKNGMIPHIVFSPEASEEYFPDAKFWDSSRSVNAPKDVSTSGITQPPIHATSALRIYERARDKASTRDFLKEMYPKLLSSHLFYYENRDPDVDGLIYIRHPWASGLDNSPTWDSPLNTIELGDSPKFERKDLEKGIPPSQRPKNWDYNRYIYLVELFKEMEYDEERIRDVCPFLIQDPLFNSIFLKANEDLAEIAQILGEDSSIVEGWAKRTRKAVNKKLWHSGHGFYDAFDLRADRMIEVDTASGFGPLYGGTPTRVRARKLYDYLDSASFCSMHEAKCFSIPNYNLKGEYFDPANYWRGPIWINMNWLLYHGLKRYGFIEKAASVRKDIIELVKRYGFYEYYDPLKGCGYGSKDFSWTAALFLDVVLSTD